MVCMKKLPWASAQAKVRSISPSGVRALYDFAHATVEVTPNGREAGISPIPVDHNTGTFTVTRENVDKFLNGRG
jgi:hypothetical protein